MPLTVEVNGQTRTVDELATGATLQQLLDALELHADRIAIEQNGEIIHRASRGMVTVKDGDRVEIVHFVGGGCFGTCGG